MSESVCGVVVTYNRKDLLRECLEAVTSQSRAPDTVLVVDNASTDGSREMVREEFPAVEVLALPENEGSAGGFHEGMKAAVALGVDWLWVMDDDTIPAADALEKLLDAPVHLDGLPAPSLLASKILWTDGRLHPMNWPSPNLLDVDHFVEGVERTLVPIRANTFPSLLVRREAVERHGLPRKGFWIWSDDIDFTQRILRHEAGYLVPQSVAVHKTKTAHAPWQGGPRFYYAVRNGLFIIRGDTLGPKEKVGWLLLVCSQIQRFLTYERFKPWALAAVLRGLRDGLFKQRPAHS
ncbi:MAG TPA: glycosyltransferase family 2 protein [Solirubrobacteraceae bacterium]|nr:glycosyltransferase family 2 protein [Solirubrobacteraceae bacterium]